MRISRIRHIFPAIALTAAAACGISKERHSIPLDQASTLDHVSYYVVRNICGHPNDDQAIPMRHALEASGIKTVLDLRQRENRLSGVWAGGIQELTGVIVLDAASLPACPPIAAPASILPALPTLAPPSASLVPPPPASSAPSIIPPPVRSIPASTGSRPPAKEIRC